VIKNTFIWRDGNNQCYHSKNINRKNTFSVRYHFKSVRGVNYGRKEKNGNIAIVKIAIYIQYFSFCGLKR
jgi:hypothetical protein